MAAANTERIVHGEPTLRYGLTLWSLNSHIMDMKSVSVAVLKENLSTYLHAVEKGAEYVVTSHRRPVAVVTRYDRSGPVMRLPVRPGSDIRKIVGIKPAPGKTSVTMLVEDRRRR